jgi:hypothetical protein
MTTMKIDLTPREAAEALLFAGLAVIINEASPIPNGPLERFVQATRERAERSVAKLPDTPPDFTEEQGEQQIVDLALLAFQFTAPFADNLR